jgi:hypothetical protein
MIMVIASKRVLSLHRRHSFVRVERLDKANFLHDDLDIDFTNKTHKHYALNLNRNTLRVNAMREVGTQSAWLIQSQDAMNTETVLRTSNEGSGSVYLRGVSIQTGIKLKRA